MAMTNADFFGTRKPDRQRVIDAIMNLRQHAKESVDTDNTVHVEPQVLLDLAKLLEDMLQGR